MKTRNLLLAVVLALLVSSCKGQEQKAIAKKETAESFADNKPEGSWKVNKEFDDNGNMIRYDSIYSWSSTGVNDDMSIRDIDSIMQSYRSLINGRFSVLGNDDLSNFFLRDSLFPNNFNSQDLFGKSLNQNFMEMDSIRRRMEKIRSEMLKDFFPEDYNK
jgi:hypothetical protein